ncbi:MAG TPA: hypothetical protein VMK05_02425 [Burkholderiales bacterium]|nr:hypothetical protein [Burkholderiales bacterium]
MKKTLFAPAVVLSSGAAAQPHFDAVRIKATQVSANICMPMGEGGNIGVSVGEDAVLIAGDQYAPLPARILDAIHRFAARHDLSRRIKT